MREGPAALAGRRLFEPLAPWLVRLPGDRLPRLDELNALLAEAPGCRLSEGTPLRCVPPDGAEDLGYEARILARGEIPTRPDNWHDCFNALVWRTFPATKAVFNRRHGEALASRVGVPGRGAVRDALTQFDECGVLVVSRDRSLCDGLAAHRWEEVFWDRRADVLAGMAFFLLGHASYDQLRAPFRGLCGKALYRVVGPEWFDLAPAARVAEADQWLAAWLGEGDHLSVPADLAPLPLLGIPGVTPASEKVDFYRDQGQFRPLPPNRQPVPCHGVV